MFGKKQCKNCREKIGNDYNFCPYCRTSVKDNSEEDWGLLGKNDSLYEEPKMPMGFNMLFNSLVKNLSRQLKDIDGLQETKPQKGVKKTNVKRGGLSISISTSGNRPPEIKVSSFGNMPEFKEKENILKVKEKKLKLPESNSKNFSGLPKHEPETNIRRLSNKVIYEISLPGVKSLKDVSIIQLENSIEIKAMSQGKVFYKIIPINLPIKKYNLSKGILVLELDGRD